MGAILCGQRKNYLVKYAFTGLWALMKLVTVINYVMDELEVIFMGMIKIELYGTTMDIKNGKNYMRRPRMMRHVVLLFSRPKNRENQAFSICLECMEVSWDNAKSIKINMTLKIQLFGKRLKVDGGIILKRAQHTMCLNHSQLQTKPLMLCISTFWSTFSPYGIHCTLGRLQCFVISKDGLTTLKSVQALWKEPWSMKEPHGPK